MHTRLCNATHTVNNALLLGFTLGKASSVAATVMATALGCLVVDVGGKRKRDLDSGGIRTRAISDWCLKPAP